MLALNPSPWLWVGLASRWASHARSMMVTSETPAAERKRERIYLRGGQGTTETTTGGDEKDETRRDESGSGSGSERGNKPTAN